MKRYAYVVKGKCEFPIDMLRYDSCYPDESADVNSILDTSDGEELGKTIEVNLRSYHPPSPTRWASFGWYIGRIKINR